MIRLILHQQFVNSVIYGTYTFSYTGKTKRHLSTTIKEHRSEKSATGQHLQTCHSCDHNFNENQFKILSTGNSDFDCKIREALPN